MVDNFMYQFELKDSQIAGKTFFSGHVWEGISRLVFESVDCIKKHFLHQHGQASSNPFGEWRTKR